MSNFTEALSVILFHEGGYVNHPADPGGETNFGITKRVARESGYIGPMREIPMGVVETIYREKYWIEYYDQIPLGVATNVFDGAVNSGPARSVRWLQEAVGAVVDGRFGPKTLAAVKSMDPGEVVRKYNGVRLRFLADLGTWQTFSRGWVKRIAYNLSLKT